jgi:formylglycine-generating enzyme required for sulfatase activity
MTSSIWAADPVVSNISAVQRAGTKLVDITYDVTADTPKVAILLRISDDGGKTFNISPATLTGAVGSDVEVGTGKVITWNAEKDWLGNFSSNMRFLVTFEDSIPLNMSLIPSGVFLMGRTTGDTDTDAPPVTVNVSSFFIGKYEVTKSEWNNVRTWAIANGYSDLREGGGKAPNHPVHSISWYDMIKWCNARSQKEGLTPCYTTSGAVVKTGEVIPDVNWSANGYRLPTEAEWEKAARGGISGNRFPWGDSISHVQTNFKNNGSEIYKIGTTGFHPNFATGSEPYTASVGSFSPNGYGLYDVSGNVWEWCWDVYSSSSYADGSSDPKGATSGTRRVYRGGSFWDPAALCRNAQRWSENPWYAVNYSVGLRIARNASLSFPTYGLCVVDTRYKNQFAIISGNYSWTAAKADAESRGGNLAILNTRGKINAASNFLKFSNSWPDLWIGLNDSASEGNWFWINNEPLLFQSWSQSEPNNIDGADHGYIWASSVFSEMQWDDGLSTITKSYLLELPLRYSIGLATTITGGTISGLGDYQPNVAALLSASPLPGYLFGSWNGAASGSTNPLTILLDSDKTVGATFVEDTRDPDSDGLTNYQEIVIHGSNQDLADTDGDGITDGTEVAQGRSPKTAEPVVTNLIATQRQGTKLIDISYDLASVTPTVNVTLEISQDGGLTYSVPVNSTTGAIGNSVTVGSGKTLVWNAGDDWDGNFSNQMRFRLLTDNSASGFSLIPAGSFTMGRTSGDTDGDSPPITVTVSQFHMGKYEVTKAEWDEVRSWGVSNGYTDLPAGGGKASNHPVHTISWFDMVKWCNARSEKEGLAPCYTVSGAVMKTGTTAPTVNWTANGYRLPTEAEWEKAARGGVSGKRFPWGADTINHNEANYYASITYSYDSSGLLNNYHPTYATGLHPYTAPVGRFAANNYGLHDMAGNVWELCWDWYGASAYVNNAIDPRGPASGSLRVARGGSWFGQALYCRASFRANDTPSNTDNRLGFRVARTMITKGGISATVLSQNIIVDVRNFTLSVTPLTNGSVSGNGSYLSGTSSSLTATPLPGYLFGSWTGDASGSTNPTTILMNSNKTVGTAFVEDTRDPDDDGLTNYQEIVVYDTNPDLADTDGDSLKDGAEVTQGRSPKVAEPVITNISATQRSGTKFVDITYDLSALTPTVKVTLEISRDGGLTYNVPVTSTTGAVGNAVTVGTGKTIVWNAGVDWDSNFSNQMRFRLVADDLQVPGFSLIPAGTFTMGRTSGDTDADAPPVNVTVSQFYMGKYEVTKAEWDEVRSWAVNNGYTDLGSGAVKANDHPVQSVSWWDVVKWCNARSQKEGLTPCYTVSGLVMKTGTTAPDVNWTANGYRLPTEAEWEKATRGEVNGKRFPWGTDTISHSEANFRNIGGETYQSGTTGYHPTHATGSTPYTSPVGSFASNGYGLHDMAGNVWEWCWDWYGASTYVNNATDPRGAASGSKRVIRGGCWGDLAIICRSANRGKDVLTVRDIYFGFRVARSNSVILGVSNSSSAQNTTVDIRNFSLSKTTTTNGSISGNGSYLSGSSAAVTATPQLGYLFGSWTGDASGSANPTTVLMDANKTVGATFVEDTRDPDSDGLTNYQEIIVRLTNPDIADTDSDGVNDGQEVTDATNPLVTDTDGDGLTDGEEKTRTTNPLAKDTDGDGLSDLEEELHTKTNPLLADTDGDKISDALEDTDNDGISNLREVTQTKTNPLLADSDADGLSDTYELVYKGNVAAFKPRIGDRLRFELRELVPQGTLKLVGTLPTGLTFNSLTGVLEGKLTGKTGAVNLSIQVLNGTTILRTIPFRFVIAAFPSGLIGTWQVLLQDANGYPQGMITTIINAPGTWSAAYDAIGTTTARSTLGSFDLSPSLARASFSITFPANYSKPAYTINWQIDSPTALANGTYAGGTLSGFRLAKIGELPTALRQVTMTIDQGEQDGFQIPAGLGWATGTLSTKGALVLSGQLGDAQSLRATLSLGATGQCILWVKPYRNVNSYIGGIISLRDAGLVPQTSFPAIESGLYWRRVADNMELSYSSGFGPISAGVTVNRHIKPASALALSTTLGLTNSEFRNLTFDGGGLPNQAQFTAMPEKFVMDSSYKLNSVALPGRVMALWQGGISSTTGTISGTIALDASTTGILKSNATVSGVVFRRNELETVGAGLIKIPTMGVYGSFRTGAFLMNR